MKVLKKGTVMVPTYRFKCKVCKSIIEVQDTDGQIEKLYALNRVFFMAATCPICGRQNGRLHRVLDTPLVGDFHGD